MTHYYFPTGGGGGGLITSVNDTDSIDLTVGGGGNLTADLRLSSDGPDAGFILANCSIRPAPNHGLRVQVSAASFMGLISGLAPINYNPVTGVISSTPASATDAGHVTTGTQTFAGDKTFNGNVYFNAELGHDILIDSTSSGTLNDFVLTGVRAIMFTNTVTLTGIAGGYHGRRIGIISSGNVTISNNDAGSAVVNRFYLPFDTFQLENGAMYEFIYVNFFGGFWIPAGEINRIAPNDSSQYGVVSTYVNSEQYSEVWITSPTHTAAYDDGRNYYYLDTLSAGGPITLTLPPAGSCIGKLISIRARDSTSFNSTVVISGGATFIDIQGSPTSLTLFPGDNVILRATSSANSWAVVAANRTSQTSTQTYGSVVRYVHNELQSIHNVAVDTTYSVADNIDLVINDLATAALGNTINLPPVASSNGREITIFLEQESSIPSAINVTIVPDTTINNSLTSLNLINTNDYVTLKCDGITWFVISSNVFGAFSVGPVADPGYDPNGAEIIGGELILHGATDSTPGVVTTNTQTFSGEKYFYNHVFCQPSTANDSVFTDFLPNNLGISTNVLDLQSCSVNFLGGWCKIEIEVLGVGGMIITADYNTNLIQVLDDPNNWALLTDSGVGIYVGKIASSSVIDFRNRLGFTAQFSIRFNRPIVTATAWS